MRELYAFSLRIGGIGGIAIRVHWTLPVVAIGLILRAANTKGAIPGSWIDVSMLMGLLFVAVLLHELGHCLGARLVDGDAHEMLLWPLGGLANVEVPPTARANFLMVVAGPLANFILAMLAALMLGLFSDPSLRPPIDPLWYPHRVTPEGAISLTTWTGQAVESLNLGVLILARFFWINWILFLLNVVLVGFPMDGGRMLQCLLWPRLGYVEATRIAIYVGFCVAMIVGCVSIIYESVLAAFLAMFIFVNCRQQLFILETGGDESVFGYDFSQGYTSLERGEPRSPRRRRQNFVQRWLQRRAARKLQRENEERAAEERRLDELLQKVQAHGRQALTDEEQRFLTRVSARYRRQ